MSKLNHFDFALLSMLAGCPTGASEYNLTSRHNIAPSTIYRLIDAGLIQAGTRKIRPPHNWEIVWVSITEQGREALKQKGSQT